jgi:hypothetical protein
MVDLYSRSYFKRSWTLQELALSKKSKVICGKSSISWSSFSACGEKYLSSIDLEKKRSFIRSLSPFFSHLWTQQDIRLLKVRPKGGVAASHLLLRSRHHLAGNPKDKVYGFSEILRQFGMKLPPPDYGKPTSVIYEETLVAIFHNCGWLYLLDIVNSAKRTTREPLPGLPSWIPDWSDPSSSSRFACEYDTCGSSRADVTLLGNDRISGQLPLRGKRFSKIQKCADAEPIPADDLNTDRRWEDSLIIVRSLRAWLRLLHTSNKKEKDWLKALSSLFVCAKGFSATALELFLVWSKTMEGVENWWEETGGDEVPKADSTKNSLEKNKDEDEQMHTDDPDRSDDENKPENSVNQDDPDDTHKDYVLTLEDKFLLVLESHEFRSKHNGMSLNDYQSMVRFSHLGDSCFLTKEGAMGTGHHTMKEGDDIVLFAGANQPMIVRANGNNLYRLIGPAYIPSIMQGEAWVEKEINVSQLEVFTLI